MAMVQKENLLDGLPVQVRAGNGNMCDGITKWFQDYREWEMMMMFKNNPRSHKR
jgi:hypothetical protein